ncbi:MAG: polymer-forming cytoskeletal protein [Myxococcales bacterium]|nr:polymer-forming cytoskeletal protein [Myxococcales bacterium]
MTVPARREGIVSEINTLLGRGTSFEGKLTFEGTVRIDGKLKGEIFSDDTLIIGEGAYVEAEIDIGEVIIQGTLVGNVRAKRGIEVLAPGRVKGDLHTPSLMVEKGVLFEGRSFMEGAVGQKVVAPSAPTKDGPAKDGPAKDAPKSVK